jgi:hypothetical protein
MCFWKFRNLITAHDQYAESKLHSIELGARTALSNFTLFQSGSFLSMNHYLHQLAVTMVVRSSSKCLLLLCHAKPSLIQAVWSSCPSTINEQPGNVETQLMGSVADLQVSERWLANPLQEAIEPPFL